MVSALLSFSLRRLAILLLALPLFAAELPPGFADAGAAIPGLVLDLRYATRHNFVAEVIDGYRAPRLILSARATEAMKQVQEDLKPFGLGLKVYDGYRPTRAVAHFARWARDLQDTRAKAEFYPRVGKETLFRDGYIAEKSGHSRGGTVDLTLVARQPDGSWADLDMGTPFDFFGGESAGEYPAISGQQRANRALLRGAMARRGFRSITTEWWHFTLIEEPFPGSYFDFPIE